MGLEELIVKLQQEQELYADILRIFDEKTAILKQQLSTQKGLIDAAKRELANVLAVSEYRQFEQIEDRIYFVCWRVDRLAPNGYWQTCYVDIRKVLLQEGTYGQDWPEKVKAATAKLAELWRKYDLPAPW